MRHPFRVLLLVLLAATAFGASPAVAASDYRVGLGHELATFGGFRSGGTGEAGRMASVFGEPTSRRREAIQCVIRWSGIGLEATFVTFGTESGNPCRRGTFVSATLTGRRWRTTNGVGPGTSAAKAASRALRRCKRDTCGVRGYALELHRIACSQGKVPGVIAGTKDGRVSRLVVRWRGCE